MTDLEIEIEQIYYGFVCANSYLKPTHFIISNETYRQLRKEYDNSTSYLQCNNTREDGLLITKTTIRGLPLIIDQEQHGHYLAIAFISTDRRI